MAGNPNAGKTTLFNALTGLHQKVANYPGVTVERIEGDWTLNGKPARLIDLPGLYSLDANSLDEQIARDVLTGNVADLRRPDVVVAVIDATNLERNLYLVTQLQEYEIPLVIALVMVDVFERQKHEIDIKRMSEMLGAPVVAVTASKGRGLGQLANETLNAIEKSSRTRDSKTKPVSEKTAETEAKEATGQNAKIFARYAFISKVAQECVVHHDLAEHSVSEKIDRVLTHRVFGLGILAIILLLLFQTIFSWSTLPMDLLEKGFGTLGNLVRDILPAGILADLLVDGVIAGVGGVLVFLPQILLLFLFISILEDSGYMARAAFLLDKFMSRFGLHGKAFLPLLSSFACAIPGIMATRTIENPKDRLATILIAPFMSCSARLPVYTLMIATFFAGQTIFGVVSLGAVLMLAMYLLGILVAVCVAFILKKTILKSKTPSFVMELPPYRLPNVRTVLQNMLTRAGLFVKRAGTVILAISILLWALTNFPRMAASDINSAYSSDTADAEKSLSGSAQLEQSYAGKLGRIIEPAIRPLGFDWKIGVALIASFAAREVLVSTLSIIYSVGNNPDAENESLAKAVHEARREDGTLVWSPLTALTLMVFFVLACQCMSTVAVVRRETNSWAWTIFMVTYMTVLAYVAALITFQTGKFLGFGQT